MNNLIQTDAEMKELKDQDRMLTMVVLLLTCLGLAVLAHVIV